MQIPLNWVDNLVTIETTNLKTIIEKLTIGGFEVEDILEIQHDDKTSFVLDISATANRSDSLSIQGISTEIAALIDQPIKIVEYAKPIKVWKQTVEQQAKLLSLGINCTIFSTIVIENLTNITIPIWLTEKLISSGITPLNNLLDFQNYVLLETGYPFAIYDFDKIVSTLGTANISFSLVNGEKNQQFESANETLAVLDESILLIKANETPISIAGLIENKKFIYSKQTTSILIEGSVFSAAQIRQQSKKLGIRTDRSARYEKSLKPVYMLEALYRLISLLRISNPTLVCKVHTFAKSLEKQQKNILLRYKTIQEILGPICKASTKNFIYISPKLVTTYLSRLNFKFYYDDLKALWNVEIPSLRNDDIIREIDLIEEIARLHSFNNFLTTLPKIKAIGIEDDSYITRRKITSCLLGIGFTEFIHYSLIHKDDQISLQNKIKLINPLINDYSYLRISLFPSLIRVAQENLKQGNSAVEGFEYGHIFLKDSESKFIEKECVSGIFGGIRTRLNWSDQEIEFTWFEAKGKMEQFFKQLNMIINWEANSPLIENKFLHPYRSAQLLLSNKKKLGTFGQINPVLANKLNLPFHLYLFELDLRIVKEHLNKNIVPVYKEYSIYPKIIKSLSFIIDQKINFKDIQNILYLNGTRFLVEINLIDEYRGASIPENHISLCLQLVFKSGKNTLYNKNIEKIVKNLILVLQQKFSVIIRE